MRRGDAATRARLGPPGLLYLRISPDIFNLFNLSLNINLLIEIEMPADLSELRTDDRQETTQDRDH